MEPAEYDNREIARTFEISETVYSWIPLDDWKEIERELNNVCMKTEINAAVAIQIETI